MDSVDTVYIKPLNTTNGAVHDGNGNGRAST